MTAESDSLLLVDKVNGAVICNPVVQIAAFKQPVYCAQFPAVFQG
jgi:hypothetical protein